MVREVRKRAAPNVTGRTSINRAAPSVRARPVDRTVLQPKQNSLGVLADSLRAASPGLNKYLNKKQNEFIEEETLRGAQAAMSLEEVDEAIASGEMTPEQSPYFQQAFMKQAGINAGQRRARELARQYNDPENFNRETGDINQFFQENLTGDLEGLEDSDFAEGYLNAIKPAEEKIRNDFTEFHIEKVRAEAREQTYQSYFNAFAAMGEVGNFDPSNLDYLSIQAQQLNLEKSELNAIAYQAAATYALQGEGNPEVFEIFKNKGKNGVGSLYYTSKYGKQIETAQKQAASLRSSERARLNNQVKFVAEQEWREKIAANGGVLDFNQLTNDVFDKESNPEGRLTPSQAEQIWEDSQEMINAKTEVNTKALRRQYRDRAMAGDESVIEDVWADENITYSQASSIEKTVLDGIAEDTQRSNIETLIKSNRPDLLDTGDYTTKEVEAVAQGILEDEVARTGNLRDGMLAALDDLKVSGVMPPQVKGLLTRANPKNPEAFIEAHNAYRALQTQAPAYLDQTFTDSGQIARFEAFTTMTGPSGFTPEQALEELSSMTDKDVEIGRSLFDNGEQLTEMYDDIEDEFGGSGNFGKMRRFVEDHIRNRLSMPDHPEFSDEIREEAIERAKNRFVEVGGTWIDKTAPGANVKGLSDAVEDFLPEHFAKNNPNTALEAKRIVPDENTSVDGSWLVLDQNGLRLGRVNPKELATQYRLSTGDLLTKHELERQTVVTKVEQSRNQLDQLDGQIERLSRRYSDDPSELKELQRKRSQTVKRIQRLQRELQQFNANSPAALDDEGMSEVEKLFNQQSP